MQRKQRSHFEILVSSRILESILINFYFRVVNCFFNLIHFYLYSWLEIIDVGEMTIAFLYLGLVIFNFGASVWLYDNVISQFFIAYNVQLHTLFKWAHRMLESTVYSWIENAKDLVLAILSGVVPKLPGPIQGIL